MKSRRSPPPPPRHPGRSTVIASQRSNLYQLALFGRLLRCARNDDGFGLARTSGNGTTSLCCKSTRSNKFRTADRAKTRGRKGKKDGSYINPSLRQINCHCERSEAISNNWLCFERLLRCARNDSSFGLAGKAEMEPLFRLSLRVLCALCEKIFS